MLAYIYRDMKKFLQRFFSQFSYLRWKLTLSYFAVTIAALLVAELVVILGISTYVVNKAKTTPEELYAELSTGSYIQLGSKYLSRNPQDIQGFKELLSQFSMSVVDIKPIQIGDFIFDVSIANVLYVVYTDAEGHLIDSLPHDFVENTLPGEILDVRELPGLRDPFLAALAGETNYENLVIQRPDDVLVGAVPVFNERDATRVVGVLAFMHQSQFREILWWPSIARQVGVSVVIITLFGGVLGTFFGFLTARGLSQRLGKLASSAFAWSRGDFSVLVDDPTNDELGHLGEVLNHMAVQLENLLAERQEMSVMDERNRLARELHDSVKQQAFAASAQLAAARAHMNPAPPNAEEHLVEAERLVYEVRQELTDLIRELHPVGLQGEGLAPAVREYAKDCEHQTGIKIDVRIKGEKAVPLDIEQTLFRIVQGALANITRHSQAENAEIRLNYDTAVISLTISDDGIGFDPDQRYYGLGLRSMRERVELFNGELNILSGPDQGTKIIVKCPY
jgi:NarL family two-component system sensor histidine kinase LiaS